MRQIKAPWYENVDFTTCNHFQLSKNDPIPLIEAFAIKSEYAMGGLFFKNLFWQSTQSQSGIVVTGEQTWFFNIKFDKMNVGDVVVDSRTKRTYRVHENSTNEIKVLEIC
jgi:hypothetical protein